MLAVVEDAGGAKVEGAALAEDPSPAAAAALAEEGGVAAGPVLAEEAAVEGAATEDVGAGGGSIGGNGGNH